MKSRKAETLKTGTLKLLSGALCALLVFTSAFCLLPSAFSQVSMSRINSLPVRNVPTSTDSIPASDASGNTWRIPFSKFTGTGGLPDQTGHASQLLKTDGTTASWTLALGTPTQLNLANATGLPASGIGSGLIAQARLGSGSDGSGTHFLADDQTFKSFSGLPDQTGQSGKYLTTNGTVASWGTVAGGGDALTTQPLSQFASTTSLQLAGVISNETGSGSLVFGTSPTLVSPALGTPSSVDLTNGTNLPISTGVSGLAAGAATFLGTPTSANLKTLITDETTTGWSLFTAASATAARNTLGATSGVFPTTMTAANVIATTSFASDNALLRADGTGTNVQSSGIIVDDSNNVSGIGTASATNTQTQTFEVLDAVDQSNGLFFAVTSDLVADKTFTYASPYNFTMTLGADTNVTFPASGTLATIDSPVFTTNINDSGALILSGVVTDTLTADKNNYTGPVGADQAFTWRLGISADRQITGLASGVEGRTINLVNVSASNKITLKTQSTSSAAANRFEFGGADVELGPSKSITVRYDATTQRWRGIGRDLTNTGVTAGSYGDGSHTLNVTVDAQGRLTAISSNALTGAPADIFYAKVDSVSFTTTGATDVYVVPAGKTFFLTSATAVITSVSGYSSTTLAQFKLQDQAGNSMTASTQPNSSWNQANRTWYVAAGSPGGVIVGDGSTTKVQVNVTTANSSTTLVASVIIAGGLY